MNAMSKTTQKKMLSQQSAPTVEDQLHGTPGIIMRESFIACCIVQKTAGASWAL